ncbi:hypothetical protein FRC03_010786 [Tulasnella sp. 419]|nr:hypothetical protein FRC03_010786 [Tulasnella sp. 419]
MSVPKGSPGLFVSMAKPLKPSPFPHKPGVIKAQPAIMEVASLIMGAIPILVLCGQAASVIQKFYKNVRGELRKKCKRLVQDIDALLVKMRLIQDVKPSNTALVDDATKLKDMLESLVADLRGLVPPSIFTITLRTGNIENRINEALQQVATCQTSFNITCAYYLLVASANIQNNIDQLATNSNHQATSIMGGLRGMERILGRIEQQASASVGVYFSELVHHT